MILLMKLRIERRIIEAVAESDDTLMEKFFEDPDSITEEKCLMLLEKLLLICN